jgi:hypothetical protein
MKNLLHHIPDPKNLLALIPEDLAGYIIQYLNELSARECEQQLNLKNFIAVFYNIQHCPPGYQKLSSEQREEIIKALMEAWSWLEREGIIAHKSGIDKEQFFFTKAGSRLKNATDLESYRKAKLLPKDLISSSEAYVGLERIQELHAIKPNKFDLSKLIELCEELNKTYSIKCYLAVAMLVRAIVDHVPPIFGCKNFAEVANNYSGGSTSFKQSMGILETSLRKIADAHLHTQIRRKETLPNQTQVKFSNDLDVLLSEIVRILK